jgi:hypothetical protein
MSRHSFSSVAGFNAVEFTIDENQIIGTGRSELPMLAFPLTFHVTYPFKEVGFGLELRELRCRVSPNDGAYLVWTMPIPIQKVLVTGEFRELKQHQIYVEIHLDRIRLATLERERKGGDLRLRLDFELLADELVEVSRSPGGFPSPVWGIRDHHRLEAKAHVVVPRTIWVENVLPQTGYGKILILELPAVPIEKCAGHKAACDALLQAQALYKQGFYHDAVGKCRLALDPFFETVEKTLPEGEKRRVPVLKSSWEARLGAATYTWLNAAFLALKKPMNEPHHPSNFPQFDQLDAQMLLAVTTAVVAYAVQVEAEPLTP